MQTLSEIEKIILENRSTLKSLGVEKIAIFGSLTRGHHSPDSDIDFLISFAPDMNSYTNLYKINQLLKKITKSEVDVVTEKGFSKYIYPEIQGDLHYVDLPQPRY